jgi:hypothetical protein
MVRIVNGAYRGEKAVLLAINAAEFHVRRAAPRAAVD